MDVIDLSPPDMEIDGIPLWTSFKGVSRPECILCTANAGTFVSHRPTGVLRICPDGRREYYGKTGQDAQGFTPNGIALTSDKRLLIANTGSEGGLWEVDRSGRMGLFAMEVDGVPLRPGNFVLVDAQNRVWLTVSTRLEPRDRAYNASVSDGFIALIDNRGARIVADGLTYPNECRFSNDGAFLYVNETFARRISRFPVSDDGTLGRRETFCVLGEGDFPDGGTFDVEGHFWITSVVSNRIYRIAPSGEPVLFLSDTDEDFVKKAELAYVNGTLDVDTLYSDMTSRLKHTSSITFGGDDMRNAYLGTLALDVIPYFRSPVAGQRPAHWNWTF